ncbi:hypothetical protein ACK8HX_08520 [Oryzobacter sp. R7]|uniref:hypothetical protein n=1 Tax=Oryzobacter faecalis TaxID=3388656 RepID=UPI00398CC882
MSRPASAVLAAVALAGLALTTACGSTPTTPGSSSPSPTSPASATPAPPPASPTTPALPTGGTVPDDVRERPAVAAALEDAADRQRVTSDQVDVAAFTPVTWNDGSLGCPKADMSYTQATIEGELLILRVGTALLQYHGRTGGPYTYCEAPSGGYAVG